MSSSSYDSAEKGGDNAAGRVGVLYISRVTLGAFLKSVQHRQTPLVKHLPPKYLASDVIHLPHLKNLRRAAGVKSSAEIS